MTFGERVNELGFAPVSRTAAVSSWSNTSITCTVPAMSPGKAGYPGTYHPVYVTVGGTMSNSVNFYIDPASVNPSISNATWNAGTSTYTSADSTGIWPQSMSDVLFDGVTFTATNGSINGAAYGALSLGAGHSVQRITFLNCTITSNLGAGNGDQYDGGVNAVKVAVWGSGSAVNDISFVGCNFGTPNYGPSFRRMGFEEYHDVNADMAKRMLFRDCVFEPTGAEPFSINGGSAYDLIDNCTFKGSWDSIGTGAYGSTVEVNRTEPGIGVDYPGYDDPSYVEFRNNNYWWCNGGIYNFQADPATYEITNPYILVTGDNVDFTHIYQTPNTSPCIFNMHDISHVRFAGCTFNTGTAAHSCCWAGNGQTASWGWYYCDNIDFTGSTITGDISSLGPGIPSTARGYWSPESNNNNIWPTAVR